MRARLALAYAGIKYEAREVDLKNKPQHLLEISPKGTVPVLLLTNNTIIDQSLDIIRWAVKQHDPDGWIMLTADQSTQIDKLINRNDTEFTKLLNHYKYPTRYPDDPNSVAYYRSKCEEFLQALESKLQQTKYLFADKLSIADIALFPFVRQFSMVEPDWFSQSSYSKLQQWLLNITNSNIYEIAMQKLSPNQPNLLQLADYHDPVLHNPCQNVEFPLSQEDQQLIADMIYSIQPAQLLAAKAPWDAAVGMAANQWGVAKRIFLYCPTGDTVNGLEVIINPSYKAVFIPLADSVNQAEDWEGCFSVPLSTGNVTRELRIRVKYQNMQGETIERELTDWPARVWQHENDHLDGHLYDDKRTGKCIEKKVFATYDAVEEFYGKIREERKREL
jgi:glutathione S-transferase